MSYAYCTDKVFFAKIPKQDPKTKETKYGELKIFLIVNGKPQPVSGPDLTKFMSNKGKIAVGAYLGRKRKKAKRISKRHSHFLNSVTS